MALPVIPPYKLTDRNDGKIRYLFPSRCIGTIGQGEDYPGVKAEGAVTIRAGNKVYFKAQSPIFEHPELLLGFGEADLQSLSVEQVALESKWDQNSTKYIRHLKSLEKFTASVAELPKESIEDLNQLPKLSDLAVDGCSMKGSDLVSLKRLPDLECLTISNLPDCSPVLKKLAEKSKLRHLAVDGCGLNDEDFLNICKLPKLMYLLAGGNHISNKNIPALLNVPKLDSIKLGDNPITVEVLPIVLKLHVRTICMPNSFYTPNAVKAIEAKFGRQNCYNLTIPKEIKDFTPMP